MKKPPAVSVILLLRSTRLVIAILLFLPTSLENAMSLQDLLGVRNQLAERFLHRQLCSQRGKGTDDDFYTVQDDFCIFRALACLGQPNASKGKKWLVSLLCVPAAQ